MPEEADHAGDVAALQSQGCEHWRQGGFDYGFKASFAVRPKSIFGFAGVVQRKSLASFRDKLPGYPNKRALPPLGEEYL
jgi:hypothetical protein